MSSKHKDANGVLSCSFDCKSVEIEPEGEKIKQSPLWAGQCDSQRGWEDTGKEKGNLPNGRPPEETEPPF